MIPAETADRLAKLLPLLASDHDGEVIATARAIGRTLTAAGLDWHALAAAVESPTRSRVFDFCSDFANEMAEMEREAEAEAAAREAARSAPGAPARGWGMKLWGDKIEPWSTVAQNVLSVDWSFPKAEGGRILTKDERERLKAWTRGAPLTNADADWLSGVAGRLNKAVEQIRARRGMAA